MANCCEYEVLVRGSKKAGHMVFESMPCMDFKDIENEEKEGSSYTIFFTGDCKWSVNFRVIDQMKKVNVDSMTYRNIEDKGGDYMQYSLRAKSEAFQCEIMVHYWSEESGFDQFDHYKNGQILKQRKIEYNYDEKNEFDWNKLEFVGHEGEYDESVDAEEQDDLSVAMFEMATKRLFAQAGSDLNNSSIGETGYDLYNWTFSEGKRQSGDGWSIAIPDGFVVVESEEDRVFEAVPQGMEEDDADSIAVRILPSYEMPFDGISGDYWMYHPYARAGIAEVIGVHIAESQAQMGYFPVEIFSVGFDDICAFISVTNYRGGSYGYMCNCLTEGKIQMIRVHVKNMTSEQQKTMDKSILAWIETFKFDEPNPSMPKKTKLEEAKVVDELKKGITTSFDAAVERAHGEYNISVYGRLKTLQFFADNGILVDSASEKARKILSCGMEVKEFYYRKADELVEKLKPSNVKASTMKGVYAKLKDLEDTMTELSLDGEKIAVALPAKVKEI